MPTIVGVRLRFSKTLWFDPAGTEPVEGDLVIVETEHGVALGTVVQPPHEVAAELLPAALKPVVRIANDEDNVHIDELEAREREALSAFRELVQKYKLDMKPVDVECAFDGDRMTFYFSAEERVDFRELVRDLAARFHARVDMRQIGVRDEARSCGGVGHCGQVLCCVRFGGDFHPVSIRMAKEQDLPLNPLKISGLCGRLMCCLRYEFDAYKDFKSRAPKRGAIVETDVGLAKVVEFNTPRETVTMRFEDGNRATIPLAGMGCAKGTGCPCSVDKEVLAEAGHTAAIALVSESAMEFEPAAAPAPAQRERPERRRRQGSSAGEGSAGGSVEQADQQPATAEKAGTSRRRRRRGGSGGARDAGAGAEQAAPAVQQGAAPGQGGEQAGGDASGGEQAGSGRRRRRRRKPSGGGGNAAPQG